MDKIDRYELLHSKIVFFSTPLILILTIINKDLDLILGLFFLQVIIVNVLRGVLIRKKLFKNDLIYNLVSSLEIVSFMGLSTLGKEVTNAMIVFSFLCIIQIAYIKGIKVAFSYYIGYILLHTLIGSLINMLLINGEFLIFEYIKDNFNILVKGSYIRVYMVAIIPIIYFGVIRKYNIIEEIYTNNQIDDYNKSIKKLESKNLETSKSFEKLGNHIAEVENENASLKNTIAEFFTLQHVSEAIISIFDPMELLRSINDIIIGVMGVSGSSVLLYDDNIDKLKLHITNIKEKNDLIVLKDNINCDFLLNVLDQSKLFVENDVDKNSDVYPFIKGRDINSIICIPLKLKEKKFGLIILEQKYHDAFNENLLSVLDIIAHQTVIAIENADLYQKMQELATIDGLTGIYNRLYFQKRLKEEVFNAKTKKYELSVAIFDIDYFKRFNDTYGHLFGDKVIMTIADKVKQSLRNTDVFARFGGEEFIILFPRTSIDVAYEKIERLRREIASLIIKDSVVTAYVTVSFGLSCYPICGNTEDQLIRRADDALYEAKKAGRNCIRSSCYIEALAD
jgi:diguanylate cyclase (GGDEF)-like protein